MKCLTPTKIMAILFSSAAWITSSSLIDPPGWTIAVTPAFAASSIPSLKGKKASEAKADPSVP